MNTSQSSQSSDTKSTLHPITSHTPLHLLTPPNALTYHALQSGYSAFAPLGTAVGGILHTLHLHRHVSIYAAMGSASLLSGGMGMLIGLNGLYSIRKKGDKAVPKWDEGGIHQRVEGLRDNLNVWAVDVCTWVGGGLGAVTAVCVGSSRLRLRSGALGVMQAFGLGSGLGSVCAAGFILCTKNDDDDE